MRRDLCRVSMPDRVLSATGVRAACLTASAGTALSTSQTQEAVGISPTAPCYKQRLCAHIQGSVSALARAEHLVDKTVFLGFFGCQEQVALDVGVDLRGILPGVFGQGVLQP